MTRSSSGLLSLLLVLFLLPSCAAPTAPTPAAAPAESAPPATESYIPVVTRHSEAAGLVQPGDLQYLGAFRLPPGGERPLTFAYGGNAMTFRPGGDPAGPGDGFPGSLFITGHDRLAYGEMPDGSQVAEVTIPVPLLASSPAGLNQAAFLQPFTDVAADIFRGLDEIPRIGIAYLDAPATGPLLHLAWGQHLDIDPPQPTHAWFAPELAAPDVQGSWYIGSRPAHTVSGYLFTIPSSWAGNHTQGRLLATGRFRDGGWSGMGPALFAYRPWLDEIGTPAPAGAHLEETTLLLYASSAETATIERALEGYQHPDEWEGGVWLETGSGKSAVLFAGTKGTGARYWYGYANPTGPEEPCVDQDFVGQFAVCRLADGTPCPDEDLVECAGHNYARGWWSSRFEAQLLLYDPAELARVAAGEMASWEPQPYAVVALDERLFLTPGIEPEMLGEGPQRRFRIGAAAFDLEQGLLYVLELFADEALPVVHVWQVDG